MDAVLLSLTVLSLAAAAGFAVVAWRVLRDDRVRSAARVASLSDAIDLPPEGGSYGENAGGSDSGNLGGSYSGNLGGSFPGDLGGSHLGDSGGSRIHTSVPVASMFDEAAGSRPTLTGRPMLRVAVVVVMALAIGVVLMVGRGAEAPARAADAAATANGTAPLELMSMRHQRQGNSLTVTGLVRNPESGVEARRVTAVVFAFDRDGAFLASGRAPLDFVVLEPDDESPFVVTLPDAGDVARYRVSFRTEAGLLRHLDRRAGQLQIAGAH